MVSPHLIPPFCSTGDSKLLLLLYSSLDLIFIFSPSPFITLYPLPPPPTSYLLQSPHFLSTWKELITPIFKAHPLSDILLIFHILQSFSVSFYGFECKQAYCEEKGKNQKIFQKSYKYYIPTLLCRRQLFLKG